MANPLKNDCENANTHTHGGVHLVGVGIFIKEMKLELMWINSTMERRRERLETPPMECPPVECRQSDGATGALYSKDRVSEWTGRWSRGDRTLGSCVWSVAAESVQASVFDRTLALEVTRH